MLIGKYIGKSDLGYYSKASNLCGNIDSVSSGVVQKVALLCCLNFKKTKFYYQRNFVNDAFAYHGYGAIDFFFLLYSI